jgi:hypothetical protein
MGLPEVIQLVINNSAYPSDVKECLMRNIFLNVREMAV